MAAKPAGSSKDERLLQLIECPICLTELQDPRLLSCCHTLCYKCAKSYAEKGNYGNKLPCPVCRKQTTLYQGGVDSLPPFFFMNCLKDLLLEDDHDDSSDKAEAQPQSGAVCSTDECGHPAVTYCTQGCLFLCQECDEDHRRFRRTRLHAVVTASEGEVYAEKNNSSGQLYPLCNHHQDQVRNMYCCTCGLPVCEKCLHSDHHGHEWREIQKQGEKYLVRLKKLSSVINQLIQNVKQAMDKTSSHAKQAEADIHHLSNNVKSAFGLMHRQLDDEEGSMLADLQEAHRKVTKLAAVTADDQAMMMARIRSLRLWQNKLEAKGSVYDIVTTTCSIERDVEKQCGAELAGFQWSSQLVRTDMTGGSGHMARVEMKQSEVMGGGNQDLQELSRIRTEDQNSGVLGLVVYKRYIFIVHHKGSTIYHYSPDGSLVGCYQHGGSDTSVQGMCLMMDRETAMLVVSDWTNKALHWIRINDMFKMKIEYIQELDYNPAGSYNSGGELMVCDPWNHKIHRYQHDCKPLGVMALSSNNSPRWVTGYLDNQYVVTDWEHDQMAIIDSNGVVTKQLNDVSGQQLYDPWDVTTDIHSQILTVDHAYHQLLIMKDGGTKMENQQHIKSPTCLCLDSEHEKLYVSGSDHNGVYHVFIYNYPCLNERVVKLDLMVQI